jgi:hypothetical protein
LGDEENRHPARRHRGEKTEENLVVASVGRHLDPEA